MALTDETQTREPGLQNDSSPTPAVDAGARTGQALRAVPETPPPTPTPATRPPEQPQAAPAKSRKHPLRRAIIGVVLLLALAGGGFEGYRYWTVGRFEMSTDDAYLAADMSILSAKVSGYVTEVAVADNASVHRGDVIARIDDADYRLAVQAADDKITMQKAAIARIGSETTAARARIDAATANVASAQATVTLTAADLGRKTELAKTDFASHQAVDTARADHDKALAALAAAKADEAEARANVAVLGAEKDEAEATLASLQTARLQAERDLSFTVIRAPVDGVVGNKAVEIGELVQPGTRLAAVVPIDEVYVEANYKETQLNAMHPGQRATIEVDAFPGRVFEGEVTSMAPASGALFSLLPPQNATGNFTKVVQRLPVHIALSPDAIAEHALRPGMSVVVTVDTAEPEAVVTEAAPAATLATAPDDAAATGRRASRVH